MGRTWKELEAEGVKRCSAMFTSGKRCRKPAIEGKGFCNKHAWLGDDKALAGHCGISIDDLYGKK